MKYSEFKKWLKNQGAIFTPAKGSHFKVEVNGKKPSSQITAAKKSARVWWRK